MLPLTGHAAVPAAGGALGLYPADLFVASPGSAASFPARQAGWYFAREWVAVPRPGTKVAGFGIGVGAFDDVRQWAADRPAGTAAEAPPLVWIAAPDQLRGARLDSAGSTLTHAGASMPFTLVSKAPLNRSYWDASSAAWFAGRDLSLRGTLGGGGFEARNLWPEDFRLGPEPPPSRDLPAGEATLALRTLMREVPRGGAQSPYAAMTLWQRNAGASWVGKPVLGIMVNGAQGDDDEAEGGHFALVTGRVQADGQIGNWLVNNFYSLEVESEKAILAAPVPLDNYLGDLNAGQGWYRPSYMVAVVLNDERAAALVQAALNRVFNQFWRHQLVYYHPNQNCASISVDTLRALGWKVPARGPSSRLLAWLGYPVIAIKEGSIHKAKLAFDYLRTDQTRLLPAVALEEAFASLLELGRAPSAAPDAGEGAGKLAAMLGQDMQALAFVRFPQFPSSRVFGEAPAVSTWEYKSRIPDDPAMAQIVPVPPRPFPPELRDPDLLPAPWTPVDYATVGWSILTLGLLPLVLWVRSRRRR